MPVDYAIWPEHRLVVVRYRGRVNDQQLYETFYRLLSDPRRDHNYDEINDARGIGFTPVTPWGLSRLRELMNSKSPKPQGTAVRVAIVADGDLAYGLARMYQVFAEDIGPEFQVFRRMDEALAWLGRDHALLKAVDGPWPPEEA